MKIKLLNDYAKVPTRGSDYAAGYDLYAAIKEPIYVYPKCTTMIDTGIAVEIPEGYFGAIFARSGLASKFGIRPANCVGVIDSDYRGPVKVALHNDGAIPYLVPQGERIAQLVIIPFQAVDFEVVEELEDTERGEGGFGSTGKN